MAGEAFDPEEAARAVAAALRPLGSPERAIGEKRYLKSDLARFTSYAEPMLAEQEFFIRKAIGWVLREISRRDARWTAEWTRRHICEMSGVTFREAVRRLPAGEAERLRGLRLAARTPI